MSKRTPKPWRVDGDQGFTVIDNSGTIICQMPYTMTAMQHYANGRLIAVAPEMLDFLHTARTLLSTVVVAASWNDDTIEKLVPECRAFMHASSDILAKIKGGGE